MRLKLETGIGLGTVISWDKGKKVRVANDRVLREAAKRLGLFRSTERQNIQEKKPKRYT